MYTRTHTLGPCGVREMGLAADFYKTTFPAKISQDLIVLGWPSF